MKLTQAAAKRMYLDPIGGLSEPSKMPCYSFSIPATYCKVGAALAKVKGTTCSGCYALKGNYRYPGVKAALEKRFQIMESDLDTWKQNMVAAISYYEKSGFFRWHDSGDLQSVDHLGAIVWIAEQLPGIKFWLPTREYAIVRKYLNSEEGGPFPTNLIVRLSAHKLGDNHAPNYTGYRSSVDAGTGFRCPASTQGNKCLDCRACWNVPDIDYRKH